MKKIIIVVLTFLCAIPVVAMDKSGPESSKERPVMNRTFGPLFNLSRSTSSHTSSSSVRCSFVEPQLPQEAADRSGSESSEDLYIPLPVEMERSLSPLFTSSSSSSLRSSSGSMYLIEPEPKHESICNKFKRGICLACCGCCRECMKLILKEKAE